MLYNKAKTRQQTVRELIGWMVLLILFAMLTTCRAHAQTTVDLAWDPHPQASQLQGFDLYCGRASGFYSTGLTPCAIYNGGSLTAGSVTINTLGKNCFVLTAVVNDPDKTQSDPSNEVCQILKPSKPNLKSAVVRVALSPFKAVGKLASVFKKQNLKIQKVHPA
jgi:hypothetical protein